MVPTCGSQIIWWNSLGYIHGNWLSCETCSAICIGAKVCMFRSGFWWLNCVLLMSLCWHLRLIATTEPYLCLFISIVLFQPCMYIHKHGLNCAPLLASTCSLLLQTLVLGMLSSLCIFTLVFVLISSCALWPWGHYYDVCTMAQLHSIHKGQLDRYPLCIGTQMYSRNPCTKHSFFVLPIKRKTLHSFLPLEAFVGVT